MNNEELLEMSLDKKIAAKRLRFMEKHELSHLVDGYLDGKHVISFISLGTPEIRQLSLIFSGYLGANQIAVTSDSYIRTGESTDFMKNYQPGSMAEMFANGDPSVSEAITVSVMNMDSAGVFSSMPYTRGYKNAHVFQERIETDQVSGNIYDEMVFSLKNGMSRKESDGFMSVKVLIDLVLNTHIASRAPMIFCLSKDALVGDKEYVSESNWLTIGDLEILVPQYMESDLEDIASICNAAKSN